jgi:hypothetical protein
MSKNPNCIARRSVDALHSESEANTDKKPSCNIPYWIHDMMAHQLHLLHKLTLQSISTSTLPSLYRSVAIRSLSTLSSRINPINQRVNRRSLHSESATNTSSTASINNPHPTTHHILHTTTDTHIITNDPSTTKRNFKQRLYETKHQSLLGGGVARINKQHEKGSLTARERVDLLFDDGSFRELDGLVTHRCNEFGMDGNVVPGDGVVVGKLMLSLLFS